VGAWTEQWLPNARAALTKLRGESGPDSRGNRHPAITALDTIPILAQFSGPLQRAIEKFIDSEGVSTKRAFRTTDVDGPFIVFRGITEAAEQIDAAIGIDAYLAGYGRPGAGWERNLIAPPDPNDPSWTDNIERTYYTIAIAEGRLSNETEILSFHRATVGIWQRCIDASANAIRSIGIDVNSQIAVAENETFWRAITSLCINMDTIAENPPQAMTSKLLDATKHALKESSHAAGELAAGAANFAGEIAGKTVGGFLSEANMLTLVVAGLAVYWFAR
jgi:hypothetical protein